MYNNNSGTWASTVMLCGWEGNRGLGRK